MKDKGYFQFRAVRIILTASLLACGPSATDPPTTIAGDWPIWDSVDALAADADLIVTGAMGVYVDQWQIVEADGHVAKTDAIHEFIVQEVIRGDPLLHGKTILVGYWLIDDPNVTPFIEGENLLLFLDHFDWGGEHDGWVPLASDSGVFDMAGAKAEARGEVGPLAGLTVEMAELRSSVSD
jgi:hypothetical protein